MLRLTWFYPFTQGGIFDLVPYISYYPVIPKSGSEHSDDFTYKQIFSEKFCEKG